MLLLETNVFSGINAFVYIDLMLLLFDANRITMVSFVFSVWSLLHVLVHLRSWAGKMEQLGSLLFFFCGVSFWNIYKENRWRSYLIQGEPPVNISMVAPFHWLVCCLTQHLRRPHRLSRKKWSVLKSAFLAPKEFQYFNCEFFIFFLIF